MFYPVISYDEPIFRPPSEALSLIFQVTIGCSWNRCAFCEMFTSKKFRVKGEDEVKKEIEHASGLLPQTRKVFLADGNAVALSAPKLIRIMQALSDSFPKLSRVSAYASPRDLNYKTVEELKSLRQAGLKLVYVGIESGDDALLEAVQKGETFNSTVSGLMKATEAGITLSVMIINGLGGKHFSRDHALNSARIVNEIQPEYLSTLVLSFPYGVQYYTGRFKGDFIPMNQKELLEEQYTFIGATSLLNTIFRSDHASNYLALKGILGRDKEAMIGLLKSAMDDPASGLLHSEWQRGL